MILSLAAAIAVLLSVMSYFSATSAALPNLAGIAVSPFRALSAAVSETLGHWADYFTRFDELEEENRQLKLKIAEMEEDVRQATFDREENAHLRKVAELREQRRDLHLESARVLVQDSSNWYSLLTINKGTAYDIEVGDCVVTEEGYLLGVVTEAGLNWATVRTILDSESSIGALVFRSGSSALAQGDFSLMGQGRMALAYLGAEPDVVAGDLIVTSGLGGYYPSQVVIGYVEEVRTGDDGLTQYAVLRPEMSLEGLTEIFVVTSFDIVE
ncbi:MAG: rod shape-determining protein MreC [Oscillospiraceae bacterium]|jgi:rod shape-determining protein MreC|nr:rod shape-determining protein MreC [Oscillospiraceae bacterium]